MRPGVVAAAGLAVLLFPFVAGPAALNLGNEIALASIGALALTILMGAAGLISLGHAALLAVGAFTVGAMTQELAAPIWLTVPVAAAMGATIGLLVGLPSLRLRGVYLAVSTLALQYTILALAGEYQSIRHIATGIVIPDPGIGPLVLSDPRAWFFVLVGVLGLVLMLTRNLLRTRTGHAWMALRERELAASSVGVNVASYKLAAFVVSSAITSVAGALGAYYQHSVAVDGFTLFVTVRYLAMVLIGGVASPGGALLGAAFVSLLPHLITEAAGALPVPPSARLYVFAIQYVTFGALLAGVLLLEPGGLIGLWQRLSNTFRKRHMPTRGLRSLHAPPTRSSSLLEVEELSVVYGGGMGAAVDSVSVRLEAGSIVALLGANGAGKTTMVRAISGLLSTESARIVQGRIQFQGQSIAGWSPDRVARSGVALVPERDKIFATLSVEQNLAVAGRRAARMLDDVLRYFPVLNDRRQVLAGYLSGGERQMLALASALVCAPRLLLIDELSLGLAPRVASQLIDLVRDIRHETGLAVLLVEQNAAAALAVADEAYVLSTGRVVKHGPAAALLADPDVRAAYLGISEGAAAAA
jgi:branched-chain amino acid transport system permease protein